MRNDTASGSQCLPRPSCHPERSRGICTYIAREVQIPRLAPLARDDRCRSVSPYPRNGTVNAPFPRMPSQLTVSDHLLQRLQAWNVRRIFAYPGDGINGILGALRRVTEGNGGERFDVVQVAHEELAGLMATAHAKFTGEVGVCLATSGPGAIHLLNGLYDAKLDHQPVVAIVGQQAFAGVGGSTQQETNLRSILQDVA